MTDARSDEAAAFLAEINARVPDGIDWKAGAISYLHQLIAEEGAHNETYHLIKPFLGGPDFAPFFVDLYLFLDVVERLDLGMRSTVIDVGCGPGWTSHWLAKLGHRVIGLDISTELLEMARRRVASDPYPPFGDEPFAIEFVKHDIETAPFPVSSEADVALFESALHHFLDPVAAIHNVAAGMAPDGVIAIIEGAAPEPGSPPDLHSQELMERFHTLERPYTRSELERLLRLTGFEHYRFFQPVNGLFEQTSETANRVRDRIQHDRSLNLVFASRRAEPIDRISGSATDADLTAGRPSLPRRAVGKLRRALR